MPTLGCAVQLPLCFVCTRVACCRTLTSSVNADKRRGRSLREICGRDRAGPPEGNAAARPSLPWERGLSPIRHCCASARARQRHRSMSFCQFSGGEIYKDHFKPGMYVCSKCNHPLFSSRSKFAHSSPWPAFTDTVREDSVTKMMETLTAYKVLCGKCGNGLGHEFVNDGPEEGVSRF